MTGPLTGLLAVTALTILALMHRVQRMITTQQKQIDALIDAVNTLEARLDTTATPPPPHPIHPPSLPAPSVSAK